MGKLVTEMLKGTLEGIVLAILSGRAAYGYEITAWLREQGFSDIAEGTVCPPRGRSGWPRAPGRRRRTARLGPRVQADLVQLGRG